ncbi:MAG: Txe/YoeB family addiction module toxin [Coriobacteriia bacterium]|nr:Txe/YoeB family addiction module toxin [Coriobacteriia bacterium]
MSSLIDFQKKAWDDYLHWQTQDKKTLQKINKLIRDIQRLDGKGIGQAELLKGNLAGLKSVRIDQSNRLIYRVEKERLQIFSCRGHY